MARVVNLATDFRREFQRDVVIDMYCFRRRGHNEADEPAFTQPALYRVIEKRPSVHESYLEKLLKLGEVSAEEGQAVASILDMRRRAIELVTLEARIAALEMKR